MIKTTRSIWYVCATVNYLCSLIVLVLMFTSNVLPWWGSLAWGGGGIILATVILKGARDNDMWDV